MLSVVYAGIVYAECHFAKMSLSSVSFILCAIFGVPFIQCRFAECH
jgi:hypothetical protein